VIGGPFDAVLGPTNKSHGIVVEGRGHIALENIAKFERQSPAGKWPRPARHAGIVRF
jgi:hypothetical protein